MSNDIHSKTTEEEKQEIIDYLQKVGNNNKDNQENSSFNSTNSLLKAAGYSDEAKIKLEKEMQKKVEDRLNNSFYSLCLNNCEKTINKNKNTIECKINHKIIMADGTTKQPGVVELPIQRFNTFRLVGDLSEIKENTIWNDYLFSMGTDIDQICIHTVNKINKHLDFDKQFARYNILEYVKPTMIIRNDAWWLDIQAYFEGAIFAEFIDIK